MSLYSLLYVSESLVSGPLAHVALNAILTTSREHNAKHGITGALLFSRTRFTQVLEGSEPVVKELVDRIRVDPRNTDLRVIGVNYPASRAFEGWAMGYADAPPAFEAMLDPLITAGVEARWSGASQAVLALMRRLTARSARAVASMDV